MGLLDDAIREHLELKRRHGGDPSEIERQEHEALGESGRGEEPQAAESPAVGGPGTAEHDRPAAVAAPYDDATQVVGEAPAPADDAIQVHDEAPAPPDDATQVHDMPSALEEETAGPVDEIEPPPDVEEAPRDGHESSAPGHEEDPWVVEEEAGAVDPPPAEAEPARPGEDDVLEETPEFLQETPEHDRLWFEQKPPRNFDWDR
jgi:hypothetical protein